MGSHSRWQQDSHSWAQWEEGSIKRICCKKLAQIYDATYIFSSLGILGIRECELAVVLSLLLALSLFLPLPRLSLYKQRFFRKLITPNLCVLRSTFLCNVTFIVAAQWQLSSSSGSLASLLGVFGVAATKCALECAPVAHCACK